MIETEGTRGKYIVIDGLDGSGKGTQFALLEKLGDGVIFTYEPGGTEYGETMREVLNNFELSPDGNFYAMLSVRAEQMSRTIIPALAKGKHVLSDRSDSSTFAYQVYGQEAKHLEEIFWTLRPQFLPRPDVYIFLDLDPAIIVERLKNISRDIKDVTLSHFDSEALEFHTRVRAGFKEFARVVNKSGTSTCHFIDASRTPEEVHNDIMDIITSYIGTDATGT